MRTLVFALCLCLPAFAQSSGPNAQLQQLTKQARALATVGKTDEAILLLQRNLATLAAKKPSPKALAGALELQADLARDRAGGATQPEGARLYRVAGALYSRALSLVERAKPVSDADVGRLFYRMQQSAAALNAIPYDQRKTPEGLVADASDGVTFCVLQCDPSLPPESATMDPIDVRNYRTEVAKRAAEGQILGGLDQEQGKKLVAARRKREALATEYADKSGQPAYSPERRNGIVVSAAACDAAGCHQDTFADVAGTQPRAATGGGGSGGPLLAIDTDKPGSKPAVSEQERAAIEEEYRRRAAMEQLRAEQERAEAAQASAAGSRDPMTASAVPPDTMYDASRQGAWNPPSDKAEHRMEERAEPGTGGGSSGDVSYSKKQTIDFEDTTVEGDLAKPTAADLASIERFPTLESPDQVDAGVEFAVQVSLTTEQVTPEAKITGGKQTAEGKLAMQLPATEEQWPIDVVLSTTGLDVVGGNNVGHIVLPREGDSTVAMFRLRARPQAGNARVMATLWHAGAYLGKITRVVTVGNVATAGASAASARSAAAAPAAKTAPAAAPAAETAEVAKPAPKPQRALAAVDMTHTAPDLTVYIVRAGPDSSDVLIDSPYLQPTHYHVPRNEKLGPWLRTEYAEMVRRGNVGNNKTARVEAEAFLHGFGRQAYEQFAPAPFKQAFWKLADKLGPKFHSIQIFTDDPALPWELMRPVRDDGTGERDFLGVEFAVARWHITEDTRQYDSPPQVEPVRSISVIAPRYEGESALAAQTGEVGAMSKMSGYEAVPGSLESVRGLLRDLPQGIVHFAGHGRAQRRDAGVQYAIQLEDGILDLMAWRGLVEANQANHPVFFMNACEVGSANQVGNFVDGWAPEVLRTGASGYIGALWAVDDNVASEFARRFYADYEQGLKADQQVDVSALVARTRREVYAKTGSPTALAYVFYGDANLKLVGK